RHGGIRQDGPTANHDDRAQWTPPLTPPNRPAGAFGGGAVPFIVLHAPNVSGEAGNWNAAAHLLPQSLWGRDRLRSDHRDREGVGGSSRLDLPGLGGRAHQERPDRRDEDDTPRWLRNRRRDETSRE